MVVELKKTYLLRIERSTNKRDTWRCIRTMSRNVKSVASIDFSVDTLNVFFAPVFQRDDSSHSLFSVTDGSGLPSRPLFISDLLSYRLSPS